MNVMTPEDYLNKWRLREREVDALERIAVTLAKLERRFSAIIFALGAITGAIIAGGVT